jgi:CRISPR-associated helicase Cas3
MIEITLLPWTEPLAVEIPDPLQGRSWLWHQVETFRLLADHPLVVNTSATGTGKTSAAHTHLLRERGLTLIVAPTNALVAQHADDAAAFVAQRGLPHQILIADAASLAARRRSTPEAQGFDNGRTLLSMLTGRFHDIDPGRPRVVVTNPDIFVRSVGFDYGRQARNLGFELLGVLDYLVIDEVHYYDGVQLSALFFALALWATGLGDRSSRRVLLLTATPDGDLSDALAALAAAGLEAVHVDPGSAPSDLPRVVSLAPVSLRLEPLGDEISPDWSQEAISAVQGRQDGAILLDRLDQVSALYAALQPALGERVRRITGPTPPEDRRSATTAPLVLATPTVDIGFNFVGRTAKVRQPLDQVWFQAPTLDRFWQRLGRVGRVLSSELRDVPSRAVAALPPEVLARLQAPEGPISRTELARRLIVAAAGEMDRARLGAATAPASADLLAFAWAGLAAATSDAERLRPFYERFPHADDQTFERMLARGRGLRELDGIRGGAPLLDPYHKFYWLPWMRDPTEQEHIQRLRDLVRAPHQRGHRRATEQLQRLVVCAGACLDAARAFRGEGAVDGDVAAWDERGFYLDRPGWISLSLERLVKRHTFAVLSAREARRREAPMELAVVLQEELTQPRSISLVLEDCDRPTYEKRRGRVYGWDRVALFAERDGGVQLFDEAIAGALRNAFQERGVAILFPFQPGAARHLGRRHRMRPWTLWLETPNRGEPVDGWVGSAAIRMEALLRTARQEARCPEE